MVSRQVDDLLVASDAKDYSLEAQNQMTTLYTIDEIKAQRARPNLYDKDRSTCDLNQYYIRHVSAMTGESLHSKSDIAKELAFRDAMIDSLLAMVEEKNAALESIAEYWNRSENDGAMTDACWYAINTALEAIDIGKEKKL